jgi:hypothetical protein
MTRSTGIRLALAAAGAALLIPATAGCTSGTSSSAGTGAAPSASPTSSTDAGADAVAQGGAGGAGGTSASPKSGPTNHTPSHAASKAPGASITKFEVKTKPSCPVTGDPGAPFTSPGNDVTIAWSVSGASKVTISVDGPGVYGTYDATGDLTLSFGCDKSTTMSTHTYLLTVVGYPSLTKKLTVSVPSNP